MRIIVAPNKMTADLVRSYLPADESDGRKNYQVDYSYEISAAGKSSGAGTVRRFHDRTGSRPFAVDKVFQIDADFP
jgi:hypothetical protein